MGKDAHTGKDIPEQWDEIKYFGITEDVLDIKGNTRYTALMYKVEKKSKGVKVSMQNPKYDKTMSWDDFMIFVLDKGLRPYHQQDIEAIQSKVEIVAMEDDETEPRAGAKNKGSIT